MISSLLYAIVLCWLIIRPIPGIPLPPPLAKGERGGFEALPPPPSLDCAGASGSVILRPGKAAGTGARRCAGAHRTSSPTRNAAGAQEGLPEPGAALSVTRSRRSRRRRSRHRRRPRTPRRPRPSRRAAPAGEQEHDEELRVADEEDEEEDRDDRPDHLLRQRELPHLRRRAPRGDARGREPLEPHPGVGGDPLRDRSRRPRRARRRSPPRGTPAPAARGRCPRRRCPGAPPPARSRPRSGSGGPAPRA